MTNLHDSFVGLPSSVVSSTSVDSELSSWIGQLHSIKLDQAIPELVLRLERLLASPVSSRTRYETLRALKGAILRAASALSKATVGRPRGAASGVGLELRLYGAMARNCRRLLDDLDRERFGVAEDTTRMRHWAMRNCFRFMGREILATIRGRQPWPAGLWEAVHDLYVYLGVRGQRGATPEPGGDQDFAPERIYKRLLLAGLVADLMDREGMSGAVMERLSAIADDCRLVEPDALVGEYDLTLVEVSRDGPPRVQTGPLLDPFRGWVLRTPEALETLLLNLDPFQQRSATAAA